MLSEIRAMPAQQQPKWEDSELLDRVTADLNERSPLVRGTDVRRLRSLLAKASLGQALVLQAGDCAEDPADCLSGGVIRKAGLIDMLGGVLQMNTHLPVIRVGRVAGQFAKPRSKPTEMAAGQELPVYRGHMVNSPEPAPELRRHDPLRIIQGYSASYEAMNSLGWGRDGTGSRAVSQLWTSHEALLLDYEIPMVRWEDSPSGGGYLLGSTHWPWIGERTRGLDEAHVALLSTVDNPVACKIGPKVEPHELVGLCERLDPAKEPGRLTFIARMGADTIRDRLPALVEAARSSGHPVVWLTDPMHGNTVSTEDGYKTRCVDTVIREVEGFQRAVHEAGGVAGGLHLETTPDEVTECADHAGRLDEVSTKYTSFCDPRLNPRQALDVVSAWNA
ncbi:3-deoxy-7-phosphoheptulonate synthase [Salinactinospora qingdaonensis]|uniref:Phospho-2-dehydro-3-deoxyheptonate aldolase n=1 Tax=Salinactinospora qingdaonensis TaxID=702744 RepID=A0ABP7FP78_9ACTN